MLRASWEGLLVTLPIPKITLDDGLIQVDLMSPSILVILSCLILVLSQEHFTVTHHWRFGVVTPLLQIIKASTAVLSLMRKGIVSPSMLACTLIHTTVSPL